MMSSFRTSLRQAQSSSSLALKGLSLVAIYALYGVLQERIIKGTYTGLNIDNAKFTSAPLLVFCNRIVSLITGLILVQLRPRTESLPSAAIPANWDPPTSPRSAQLAERIDRFKPSSSLWHYALVAALNNAATLSQYGSLSYLSFTTATLGKSAKMVPVLVLGYVGYGKQYKVREWAGVAVVMIGIWSYLVSLPEAEDDDKTTNWLGLATLLAYLIFDGLTSTTQERVFNKAKNEQGTSLLGISAGVMDQMIWINLFSSIIAFAMVCLSPRTSAGASIKMLLTTPELQLHVLLLSATATLGLLMLFHVISCYGALIAGMIMTLRQFVSVICNAIWFGNMTDISGLGWMGIGLVASGVWIKMDRRFDVLREETGPETTALVDEKPVVVVGKPLYPKLRQYALPLIVCPLLFLAIKCASTVIEDCFDLLETIEPIVEIPAPIAAAPTDGEQQLSESGNPWDNGILAAVNPDCPAGPLNSIKYNTNIRTAIATYPRSGSSYTRTLIERATGYQTSCIYCDKPFDEFFKGECDGYENPWLIKTHFPSELKHKDDHSIHWASFDRYLEVVRNPIDIMWSVRSLMRTHDHSAKLDIKFTMKDKEELQPHLQDWVNFLDYWANAPIEGLVIRYEDIRSSPFANIAKMTDYLLPTEHLPSLKRMACAVTLDAEKEMYPSGKISPFRDWEQHFDKDVFEWIVQGTEKWWCKLGYDRLLEAEMGWRGPVNCKQGHQLERISVPGMQGP